MIFVAAESRSLDNFSWMWKWQTNTSAEQHGFVLIRNCLVHHGTVAVSVNVGSQSLDATPFNMATLGCVPKGTPRFESCEMIAKPVRHSWTRETDESVPK